MPESMAALYRYAVDTAVGITPDGMRELGWVTAVGVVNSNNGSASAWLQNHDSTLFNAILEVFEFTAAWHNPADYTTATDSAMQPREQLMASVSLRLLQAYSRGPALSLVGRLHAPANPAVNWLYRTNWTSFAARVARLSSGSIPVCSIMIAYRTDFRKKYANDWPYHYPLHRALQFSREKKRNTPALVPLNEFWNLAQLPVLYHYLLLQ